MNQAQVNAGAAQGVTDQQLLLCGASAAQLAAIPAGVRPVQAQAAQAVQAHANVNVAAAPPAPPPPPQPQVLMAQQAQHQVAQFMGVALPVHTGSAAFRLTTMAPWLYVLSGVFGAALIWFAIAGWMRPTGASVTTPPAVTTPVAAAPVTQPIVVKIDPIKIDVQVTPVKP